MRPRSCAGCTPCRVGEGQDGGGAGPVLRLGVHPGPESEVTTSAWCLDGGCTWEAVPTGRVPEARRACEGHTARTGHAVFAVRVEYVALVARG